MSSIGPVLLFAVGLVIVVGLGVLAYVRAKARREALFTFAATHNLEYSHEDPFGLTGFPFALFSLGDGRGCENVVWGSWNGVPMTEADYWYYEESTDSDGNTSRSYTRFSVVLAELSLSTPAISIQPETLFTRLADHLGFHDIDFESEEFNKRYQVKSPDREFAFKVVDARMIQWLLSLTDSQTYELVGNRVLVATNPLRPEELGELFDRAADFSAHVPRLVWNEYGTGEPAAPEERSAP